MSAFQLRSEVSTPWILHSSAMPGGTSASVGILAPPNQYGQNSPPRASACSTSEPHPIAGIRESGLLALIPSTDPSRPNDDDQYTTGIQRARQDGGVVATLRNFIVAKDLRITKNVRQTIGQSTANP